MKEEIILNLTEMGRKAKKASVQLACAGEKKTQALQNAARLLNEFSSDILKMNKQDLEQAKANGLSTAMCDRLLLTEDRIFAMSKGLKQVASQPDPIGRVFDGQVRPNGLKIEKVSVPLGVVGIIYEARPNVTSDAAALCLKSGNAVILRGGKEALNSNTEIAKILQKAAQEADLPAECVQLVKDTSHDSALAMMNLTEYLNVLIPRGGAGLIRSVVKNSHVPVIRTGEGNCHIFIDKSADIDMAVKIVVNAKASRPSVCNAVETVLVHKDIAEKVLPVLAEKLSAKTVVIRGCEKTKEILPSCQLATDEDWQTEYLDYILAIKVTSSMEEALSHIERYSTGHSEAIVTKDYMRAEKFVQSVDSAAVYVNASTRFTDGGEFGLGAEIGISTQKLHARGPMGLQELTSYKYIIRGEGQIR